MTVIQTAVGRSEGDGRRFFQRHFRLGVIVRPQDDQVQIRAVVVVLTDVAPFHWCGGIKWRRCHRGDSRGRLGRIGLCRGSRGGTTGVDQIGRIELVQSDAPAWK
jgi:hypothetical protein